MKFIWLLALSGCAQLLGLDDTTSTSMDAPGPGVHFAIQLENIGATIIDTPDDPAVTHDTVAFLVPDGATYRSVPATLSAVGAWTGDIATGNPLVDFTIDGNRHIWNVPTRDLKMTNAVLGHPNPVAPPDGSVFDLAIAVPGGFAGTEKLSLLTVGAWSQQEITTPMAMASSIDGPLMYSPPTAIGGPLAKITPTDAVLVLRRRISVDTTYPLDGVFQTSIDQTGTDALTGSLVDTAVDKTVNAQIAPTALATRFTAVRPAVATLTLGWACVAAPGYQRGVVIGPTLNNADLLPSATTISGAYGNPFASLGWQELLFYNSYETRTVTLLPDGQTFGLSAGLQTIVQPSVGQTFDMPAGLPQTISLNDAPLTSDNMAVYVDPAKYVHITMVNDRTTNTFVQAELFEVSTPDSTTLTTKLVIDALAVDPTALVLPPDVFVNGHTYFIQAITRQGGWPNIATGDFQTQAPPFYVGYSYSGVFTVSNTP